MKNNFDYLIEQFKHARGIKKADIYSKSFIAEFADWLHERKLIGEEFVSYLNYLDFFYENANCAEIGKGDRDTIVKPFNTKMITLSDVNDIQKDRLIVGNFKVYENNACVLKDKELVVIPDTVIDTYLVHNPYSFNSINGIEDLHNNGTHNIIVGIYGNCSDKDRIKKMERIDDLFSKLDGDVTCDYDTFEGAYYYVIGSVKDERMRLFRRQ